jgi:hypothetical protein
MTKKYAMFHFVIPCNILARWAKQHFSPNGMVTVFWPARIAVGMSVNCYQAETAAAKQTIDVNLSWK